jgi:hypothetical protein
MSRETASPEAVREQANERYWDSDDTVDTIARELGLSRKAMYAAVSPRPTGDRCPTCADPLVFTNRTTRAAGTGYCAGCEAQLPLESARVGAAAERLGDDALSAVEAFPSPRRRLEQLREDLAQVPPERYAMIGGAAALGVAAGAAAIRALRKR